MRTLKILFILVFLFLPLLVYAQYRDPFGPLLPDEEVRPEAGRRPEAEIAAPEVTVEGILWSKDESRAIIDGEVYKAGDTLRTVDAEVIRVDKRVVIISYQGKIFRMSVEKREGK